MVTHCSRLTCIGLPSLLSTISNHLNPKINGGMNEAPVMDFATCEDVIQTAGQKSLFSLRIQRSVDICLAADGRGPLGIRN